MPDDRVVDTPNYESRGARRSIFDLSSKSPMVAMVAAEASYVM